MDSSVKAHLQQLEERLLDASVRRCRHEMVALLADDFVELGSSGRVFNREQIIDAIQNEPMARRSLTGFDATLLAPDVALVTYRAIRHSESANPICSLRSLIWKQTGGRWQMRFHQGTLVDQVKG